MMSGMTAADGGTGWAPPRGGDAPPTAEQARPRRGLRLVAVVTTCLVVAGAAVGIVLGVGGSSSARSLSGMSAAQVLSTSLAAARGAGSFHAALTSGAGASADRLTLDTGPAGGTLTETGQGAAGTYHFLVVGATAYLQAPADLTAARDGGLQPGRWYRVPPSDTEIYRTLDVMRPATFISTWLALSGPLSESPSGAGGSVEVRGRLPRSSADGSRGGDAATLTVSGRAPFYPLRLTYSDAQAGPQTYTFDDWGGSFRAQAPADATPLPTSTPQAGAADVPTEADLQTALTAAKVFFTQNDQDYAGFGPATFTSLDTGLTDVPAADPSTGPAVVSVRATSTWVVLAGWSPQSGNCWAIVDRTAPAALDGTSAVGTLYAELPGGPRSACRASTFATPGKVAGERSSTEGFASVH